jgi:carbonic anhydrase
MKPGELFVVRNVANLVPKFDPSSHNGAIAAIEFAIQGLGVKNIVVQGHALCGGVNAYLNPSTIPPRTPVLTNWCSTLLKPAEEAIRSHKGADHTIGQLEMELGSVEQSLEHLKEFPLVKELLAEQKIELYGAWFDVASGDLSTFNPAAEKKEWIHLHQ